MNIHKLKTWPKFFAAVSDDSKTFEVRKNDRGFNVGDHLLLQEYTPCATCGDLGKYDRDGDGMYSVYCPTCNGGLGSYSGREILCRVTYIMNGPAFGLDGAHCIMAISKAVK